MKRLIRGLYAGIPLVVLLALVGWTASNAGSYRSTWLGTFWALNNLAPQYQLVNDYSVSMYQLNDALRRLAHILIGFMAVIVMDRILRITSQLRGGPRLAIACCLSLVVIGTGAAVRYRSSLRHVRTVQLVSSATGMLFGVVVVSFAALDRRIVSRLQDAPPEVVKVCSDDGCTDASEPDEEEI
ncbi:MAG: hypothetical protein ACKO14_02815 [Armatimonadota bacterium]